ncbi:hypothetical protein JRO89_XS13G0183100 [Xanthoceras sorbifolium]|uniref:Uncharacterized protein n=1 Tax=Xanthoceras sorbifolium TaxID=99658 RepID=A0ABQ8H8Y5_9ROSI|nr:hypothetical protein JRO89_XS13G0183100 [Xanthoceras sorbifolium]
MGRTVGHWFHPNHDGHNLSKKRTDHDFSVQNIGDVNFHRYKPFQLLAGISATTKRIYVEGSFVEPEYRLLPNHHIINVSENISVEMKSQLLPNQHLSSNAEDRLCCKRPFFRGITSDAKQISSTFGIFSNVLNLPSDREQEYDFGTSLSAVQSLLPTSIHQSRSQGLISVTQLHC